MDSARKRGRPNANGGASRSKRAREGESNQPGLGGKSKPCTKFFSTSGCPFGEGCHFQHHVPGGFNPLGQMTNRGNPSPFPPRNPMVPPPMREAPSAPAVKTRMCTKYNTAEGCRFGDKCHFAHGERELGKSIPPSYDNPAFPSGGRSGGWHEPPPPVAAATAAASFGASATAKISVDASLAGAIIGKGGANTKQIYRVTGAKLNIKDHESDTTQRNIELEGTFDQIKMASAMVKELIMNISATMPLIPAKNQAGAIPGATAGNYKTKLCELFAKGTCTFGDRCRFAHGEGELRHAAPAGAATQEV